MTPMSWSDCFPHPHAEAAVKVVHTAWVEITNKYRPHFNAKTREPDLTVFLCQYVRDVVAVQERLMGHWGAENVEAVIDHRTGKIAQQRRTDIQYFWNSDEKRLDLTFEFKKLNKYNNSRTQYIGENGMQRFVGGIYARNQPVAVMVGILTATYDESVPPLKLKLQEADVVEALSMRANADGDLLLDPSELFPAFAEFDTRHKRATHISPDHDVIQLAHMFLAFS